MAIGINLWSYNTAIFDTFVRAPEQLAQAAGGNQSASIGTVDQLGADGARSAEALWDNAGVFNDNMGFYRVAGAMYFAVGLLAVTVTFILALAKIMLSIVLAIGPLFIAMLFFKTTRRFFENWIGLLANYALVTILTVLAARLLLQFVSGYATTLAAAGGSIQVVDTLDLILGTVLLTLVIKQVPSMASNLANGIAMYGYGLVNQAVSWGLGRGQSASRGVYDAMTGGGTSRYDRLSRKGGYYLGLGARAAAGAAWRATLGRSRNSVRIGRASTQRQGAANRPSKSDV